MVEGDIQNIKEEGGFINGKIITSLGLGNFTIVGLVWRTKT